MSSAATRITDLSPENRRLAIERLRSKKQARIARRPQSSEPAPLSYAQQRFWFLQQLDPWSAQYNLPFAARIEGPLDSALLQRALRELVGRHESLRTTFAAVAGTPMQFVAAPGEFDLPVTEVVDSN